MTFARDVGVRSVTLAGDVYDPSGTLSGGAAPSGSGILIRVQELIAAGERLEAARRKLETLEREAQAQQGIREEWRKLAGALEMAEHEAGLVQGQVQGSNAARVSYVFVFVSLRLMNAVGASRSGRR